MITGEYVQEELLTEENSTGPVINLKELITNGTSIEKIENVLKKRIHSFTEEAIDNDKQYCTELYVVKNGIGENIEENILTGKKIIEDFCKIIINADSINATLTLQNGKQLSPIIIL